MADETGMADWYVYIVRCADSSLYTGITTDVTRRLAEHNEATTGAKCLRGRRPVSLVYCETVSSRSDASKREYQIKAMNRAEKEDLLIHTRLNPARQKIQI